MKWHDTKKRPKAGRRVVALYEDGSGAQLFFVQHHTMLEQDGDTDTEKLEKHFTRWAYLPEDFKLNFELEES